MDRACGGGRNDAVARDPSFSRHREDDTRGENERGRSGAQTPPRFDARVGIPCGRRAQGVGEVTRT